MGKSFQHVAYKIFIFKGISGLCVQDFHFQRHFWLMRSRFSFSKTFLAFKRKRFLNFQRDFWLRRTRFLISYRDFQRFLRSDLPHQKTNLTPFITAPTGVQILFGVHPGRSGAVQASQGAPRAIRVARVAIVLMNSDIKQVKYLILRCNYYLGYSFWNSLGVMSVNWSSIWGGDKCGKLFGVEITHVREVFE